MTTQLDNIDRRLIQLVAATEGLLQVTQQQDQAQRERFDQLLQVTQEQGENITRLATQQREQLEQEMVALRELRQITEKQAETARLQTENIKSLTASVALLARSVDMLARSNPPLVETSRRALRTSESTELLANRILDELRDLVEQLRDSRS